MAAPNTGLKHGDKLLSGKKLYAQRFPELYQAQFVNVSLLQSILRCKIEFGKFIIFLGITDIYAQMEAAAEQDRIRKAMQKKPQARSRAEIERIIKKTEDVCYSFVLKYHTKRQFIDYSHPCLHTMFLKEF